MDKDPGFHSIGEDTRRNLGELGHISRADLAEMVGSPQWDHGKHTIDGKTVFIIELNRNISKLHLVSFPEEVEEEQIRDIVKQKKLRGLTQDEWRVFRATIPEQTLKSVDFDIALMFTGLRDDSEAEFPATMIYNPRLKQALSGQPFEIMSNWTQRFWSTNLAFLFAQK